MEKCVNSIYKMNMQSQYYRETVINRIFWLNKQFQVVLVGLIPCTKLYNENQFNLCFL